MENLYEPEVSLKLTLIGLKFLANKNKKIIEFTINQFKFSKIKYFNK